MKKEDAVRSVKTILDSASFIFAMVSCEELSLRTEQVKAERMNRNGG